MVLGLIPSKLGGEMGASKAIQIMAAREREGRWEGGRGRERQTDKQSLQLAFSLFPLSHPTPSL